MSALSFLIALAVLCGGTYAMRLAGIKVGAALAIRGKRASANSAAAGPSATEVNDPPKDADSTTVVTKWMDRATVVLIAAVCATTAVFDGKDIADPARLIGVGVGVLASILRVPMLICVFLGMGVCALIRYTSVI